MRMLYESYGMDEKKYLVSYFELIWYLLRMLSYRRQRNGEVNMGFVLYIDKSFMSIFYQNYVLGFQFKIMIDQWVGFNLLLIRFVVFFGMGFMVKFS